MKSGELFGFLSPNDAGKTTTVRMIAGVIKTDAGSISIMGYDVERDPLKAKQMARFHSRNSHLLLRLLMHLSIKLLCF